jgi:hypothetical protein
MKIYEITKEMLDALPKNPDHLNKHGWKSPGANFASWMAVKLPDFMCKKYPELMATTMGGHMSGFNPEYLCKHHPEQIADFNPALVFEHNPLWMCNHNPQWVLKNKPNILAQHRPEWMAIHAPKKMSYYGKSWLIENFPSILKENHSDPEIDLPDYVEESFLKFKSEVKP